MRFSILIKPVNADYALKELVVGDEGDQHVDFKLDPQGIGFLSNREADALGRAIQRVINDEIQRGA